MRLFTLKGFIMDIKQQLETQRLYDGLIRGVEKTSQGKPEEKDGYSSVDSLSPTQNSADRSGASGHTGKPRRSKRVKKDE